MLCPEYPVYGVKAIRGYAWCYVLFLLLCYVQSIGVTWVMPMYSVTCSVGYYGYYGCYAIPFISPVMP